MRLLNAPTSPPSDLKGGSKYDLICNIVHEGKAGEGVYRLHAHRKVEEIW